MRAFLSKLAESANGVGEKRNKARSFREQFVETMGRDYPGSPELVFNYGLCFTVRVENRRFRHTLNLSITSSVPFVVILNIVPFSHDKNLLRFVT